MHSVNVFNIQTGQVIQKLNDGIIDLKAAPGLVSPRVLLPQQTIAGVEPMMKQDAEFTGRYF